MPDWLTRRYSLSPYYLSPCYLSPRQGEGEGESCPLALRTLPRLPGRGGQTVVSVIVIVAPVPSVLVSTRAFVAPVYSLRPLAILLRTVSERPRNLFAGDEPERLPGAPGSSKQFPFFQSNMMRVVRAALDRHETAGQPSAMPLPRERPDQLGSTNLPGADTLDRRRHGGSKSHRVRLSYSMQSRYWDRASTCIHTHGEPAAIAWFACNKSPTRYAPSSLPGTQLLLAGTPPSPLSTDYPSGSDRQRSLPYQRLVYSQA